MHLTLFVRHYCESFITIKCGSINSTHTKYGCDRELETVVMNENEKEFDRFRIKF